MGFLSGKRILVTGVASKLSIAYGIAQAMHREGAELAFTYQNDKLKGRVEEFAAQLGSDIVLQCDVAEDTSIDTMFAELGKVWPKFDGFVHSIGFAPGDQLDGDYVNAVTREGFKIAHDISSYSFVAMAKACRSMLNPGSALLTLSYLGAERAIPNYNVMGLAKASLEANVRYMANAMGPEGVRVNAISAGPIRTLAASGIKDFRKMLAHCEAVTPIRRTVTIEDVGNSAAFLCSDLSAGISGEVVHVDGGFQILSGGQGFQRLNHPLLVGFRHLELGVFKNTRITVRVIIGILQRHVGVFRIQGTVIRLVQLSVIIPEIPAGKGFLRRLNCQKQTPVLSIDRHPGIAAKRRRHPHKCHHVVDHVGFQIAVVLKGGVQRKFVQPIVIPSVQELVKFQLEAIAGKPVFLRQPQRVVALGPQPNIVKRLSVDFDGAGHIFFLFRVPDKSTPVLDLNINGVHPAVVKKPGHISRVGAGFGNPQLFAEHQQQSENRR